MAGSGLILMSYSYNGPFGTLTAKKFVRSLTSRPSVPKPGRTGRSLFVSLRERRERNTSSCESSVRRSSISVEPSPPGENILIQWSHLLVA